MKKKLSEKFGKFLAAIEQAEKSGSVVSWREKIGNNRFEIALRKRRGSVNCLIVIDCVDSEKPLNAKTVENFFSKAQNATAQMAILVALAGFQEEARKLATGRGVRLLDQEMLDNLQVDKLSSYFELILSIHTFRFQTANQNHEIELPEEPGILSMCMQEIRIEGGGISTSPESLLNQYKDEISKRATATPQKAQFHFTAGTVMIEPSLKTRTPVSGFSVVYHWICASEMKTTEGINDDPYLVKSVAKAELARRNQNADVNLIRSGFDTVLEAGKYYFNPRLQFSYYCEKASKKQVTMVLIESIQKGHLIQARFRASTNTAKYYVEVVEPEELERLRRMYDRLLLSDKSLETRVKAFLDSLEDAENIDQLMLTTVQSNEQRADFFLNNRAIICELKALQADTSGKVEKILDSYSDRSEFPLFYGAWELEKILRNFPDKDEIEKKIFNAATDSIEGIVEKANRQIRSTKATFNLSSSQGLLIIFNNVVEIFSPEAVAHRVRRALSKRTPDGGKRFDQVSAVLILNTAHYVQLTTDLTVTPIITIADESNPVADYLETLLPKWSAFDGQPHIRGDGNELLKQE